MKIAIAVLVALVGALVGCAEDNPVEVANQPPVIAFTFDPLGVQKGVPVNLSVSVSDPDDENLSVSWSITRGTLTSQNPAKTIMQWLPPDATGLDTVTVQVSDGKVSRQVVEPLYVCTRTTAGIAQAFYQASDSPYIIAPSSTQLLVDEGAACTIDAGVVFLIDTPGLEIQVLGDLSVQGTVDEPVTMRPNDRTLSCQGDAGWWNGINVRSGIVTSGTMDMDYAVVSYGETNVLVSEGGTASVSDSRLICGKDAGAKMAGSRWLRVERCEITSNTSYGVDIFGIASRPDSVRVLFNTIRFNGNTGIHMRLDDGTHAARITVARNLIEWNGTNGIQLEQAVFPDIHQNHFAFNGHGGALMNLRLETGYPGSGAPFDTLDATLNYWGASFTNPIGIEQTIRDSFDDGGVGTRVKVEPWLNASPIP